MEEKIGRPVFSQQHVFMQQALSEAKIAAEQCEVPVGVVIVHNDQIVAKAHNQVEMLKDPTAHAEMIAITQASSALSCKWLYECMMYVTIEPCAMCAGALVLSRIDRLVFGADDSKAGACGGVLSIASNDQLNHSIKVERGLMENDCSNLMKAFFESKRRERRS